jgi:hypothetical protein
MAAEHSTELDAHKAQEHAERNADRLRATSSPTYSYSATGRDDVSSPRLACGSTWLISPERLVKDPHALRLWVEAGWPYCALIGSRPLERGGIGIRVLEVGTGDGRHLEAGTADASQANATSDDRRSRQAGVLRELRPNLLDIVPRSAANPGARRG